VDVDRLVVPVRLLPHLGEQFAARHDDPGPGGEKRQQVELSARQVQ